MKQLLVIEREREDLCAALRLELRECGARDVQITRGVPGRDEFADYADLIVLSPLVGADARLADVRANCRILLLPDGVAADEIEADCIVTYGMSVKSTITLSSIGEPCSVVALLREVATADGVILDRQELCIPNTLDSELTLAVTGALLLLGYRPRDARIDA